LMVDLAWGWAWLKARLRPEPKLFPPGVRQLEAAPRRRIAILLPLWREHAVVGRMLEHTLSAIRYEDYEIFAGAYPNDERTQDAVRAVADRFPNIHLALCPHPGPTSKADCLNWIYEYLTLYEEEDGQRFDVIVTHDAEDLVHPDELLWINYYSARYAFIQIPVLPLPTPFRKLTHGIYCDEFAEYHTRDMVVRPLLGGFLPSAGVGTGYSRDALYRLAEEGSGQIFHAESLTEDYENGWELYRLGRSQAFVPPMRTCGSDEFFATREFFPMTWTKALRQRTRWVIGITLQSWQRNRWRGSLGEKYWLWRDRKGLVTNPLSFAANLIFVYGLATALWTRMTPLASRLAMATMFFLCLRFVVRSACVARIYGPRFALGVAPRYVYANFLNLVVNFRAVTTYAVARAQGKSLAWAKTDHAFPSGTALQTHRRKLGEILVSSGYLTGEGLKTALITRKSGVRLGEHLVRAGQLDEVALYDALSIQQGLPIGQLDPDDIPRRVAHAIPAHAVREFRVLPFRIAEGSLFLAGPDIPSAEVTSALRRFTSLELRFHLVIPSEFEKLTAALL
jgi:adsorption protein B